MRLGVLDVGSNTVHLLVVDAHRGGHPAPVRSHKSALHLAELRQPDGSLGEHGTRVLAEALAQAGQAAEDENVEDLVAFATSAVREAPDGAQVLAHLRQRTQIVLDVLSGQDEARLTFLAVRRWFGFSAGRLLCLDIGGGSLEMAAGRDEDPDVAVSLPLGASRLTRDLLHDADPPSRYLLAALREHVRTQLAQAVPALREPGPTERAVVTSKTFRSLARLAGAAPYRDGPGVPRSLTLTAIDHTVVLLAQMSAADRARLPGVSGNRAHQLLAGAVVAAESLRACGLESVDVCPWALREGVILRRLDWLAGS